MNDHIKPSPEVATSGADWSEAGKYRTLSDSIDQGFCVVEVIFDAAGRAEDYRFIEVNASFERQTGLLRAVGKRMLDLAPSHERFWIDTYADVALTGRSTRFEHKAEALGFCYDVFAFRVADPSKHWVAILFNDVSEKVAARHAAQEALRRKDEFIAVLAHELRNPLAPMRNVVALLRVASGKPEAVSRAAAVLERQVDHMSKLVDDLTDAGRIERGLISIDARRIDLRDALSHGVELARQAIDSRGHAYEERIPHEPVEVDADPHRVAQAAGNLLVNAAKYTSPGGSVSLELRVAGSEAVVEVADSGVGIPAERLVEIFSMFSQIASSKGLSQGGLGIGLAIVDQVSRLHGGRVEAFSDGPGRGSRFVMRLPLAARSAHDR